MHSPQGYYKLVGSAKDLLDTGDMQLLQQFKENKDNNKEVCARMKANDSTKLLQQSQKNRGDFNGRERSNGKKKKKPELRNVKINLRL